MGCCEIRTFDGYIFSIDWSMNVCYSTDRSCSTMLIIGLSNVRGNLTFPTKAGYRFTGPILSKKGLKITYPTKPKITTPELEVVNLSHTNEIRYTISDVR